MKVHTITMRLRLAQGNHDLQRFRSYGFMYFLYNPVTEEYFEQPMYVSKSTDFKELVELFVAERIYIPQDYFDTKHLIENYEKISD